jgi:hypothetical protein
LLIAFICNSSSVHCSDPRRVQTQTGSCSAAILAHLVQSAEFPDTEARRSERWRISTSLMMLFITGFTQRSRAVCRRFQSALNAPAPRPHLLLPRRVDAKRSE